MSAAAKILRGLVSKTDQALDTIKREKGTGAEFLRELEKTPGVKPAEIKDRRLDKVLPAMGKTTKAEVKKVLERNPPPRIEEQTIGPNLPPGGLADWLDRWAELNKGPTADAILRGDSWDDVVKVAGREGRQDVLSRIESQRTPTSYGKYAIPGGENYREILLKLPSNRPSMKNMSRDEYDAAVEAADRAGVTDYRSSHWDETPNVLAHARVSDRTGPNGERILHIEEIQSDWHQAGRKQGYLTPEKIAEIEAQQKAKTKAASELREIQTEYDRAKEYSKSLDAKIASPEFASLPPEKQAQFRESAQSYGNAWLSRLPELMKAREAYESIPAPESASRLVPDAPFKKSWHELTIKRLLNYAAENNYDRIAITPGSEQASRYDLSKHVQSLIYVKNDDGTYLLQGNIPARGGESYEFGNRIKPDELQNYVGKDVAEKIQQGIGVSSDNGSVKGKPVGKLSGLDLQVGGEGMKGFYDKILPDYLNSLGKPYGASVGRMDVARPPANSMDVSGLPLGEEYIQGRATWSEFLAANPDAASRFSTPLHSFDITPQMRQEIASKGLPLYSVPAIEGAAATGAGAAMFGEQEKAPVHISDNPDTMRLELEDKKMAGGGVAKALKEALKPLPRAAAKTKPEIEAIAERMAPQVLGEYVRQKPKSAVTVAGKTKKQFEREKELPVDVRGEVKTPETVDVEKLKGNVVIGIPGDSTITDRSLYGVGDVRLESAAPQHGGPLYGLGRPEFWASGIGPATRVQNLAAEVADQYGAPVLGKYVMMGPESINYAQHFADANLQAINPAKMTQSQIDGFNDLIRRGSPKSGPRPSFPGIEDTGAAYLHFQLDPELRKHFNALMQQPKVTEAFSLPSGQDIRFAVTEPALRNLETGVTGYSLGRMKPGEGLKLSEHPTYSHDIPGEFMGQSRYPMPYELSFPDTLRAVRENPAQAPQEFGSLKMVGPRQIIDQQMIDEIRIYEEAMKRLTGKKKGGVVKLAAGGLSKAAVEALTKMRSLSKEFAEKSAEYARYTQETTNVPTKQLPSFEEWKALQMNATPENIEQLRKETGNKRGGSIKKKR
jgi:hypothetical protein